MRSLMINNAKIGDISYSVTTKKLSEYTNLKLCYATEERRNGNALK